MTLLAVLSCSVGLAALFQVETIPLPQPAAHCLLVSAGKDNQADLCVLSGNRIEIYDRCLSLQKQEIDLPAGSSAFDVADTDSDGVSELLVVNGMSVFRMHFRASVPREPEELMQVRTLFTDHSGDPFPYVLSVKRSSGTQLVLPTNEALEIRAIRGALVERYPVKANNPGAATFGRPFSSRSVFPRQVTSSKGVEFKVSRLLAFDPQLREDLFPVVAAEAAWRHGAPRQALEALERTWDLWPWFPLRTLGETPGKVLYAFEDKGTSETHVRILQGGTGLESVSPAPGPVRKYPGRLLISTEDLPDFNGDGYTDLVLWKAPDPGPSINALTGAAVRGTWPVRLTMHLYSPEKGRFEPRPVSWIEGAAPIAAFFSGENGQPLSLLVLRDFDGDGRTDLGCGLAARTFSVWLARPEGFMAAPDFEHLFPEDLRGIEFKADLDGLRRTSLALRGTENLYVLRADSTTNAAPVPLPPLSVERGSKP